MQKLLLVLRDSRIERERGDKKADAGKDSFPQPIKKNQGAFQTEGEAYAVYTLGKLQAVEAVVPLLDIIETENVRAFKTVANQDRNVIQALVSIGKPASQQAIHYLARDKSSDRARMYVRVIARIEGVRLGREMVRFAAEDEKDPGKKSRLQTALDLFKDADKANP